MKIIHVKNNYHNLSKKEIVKKIKEEGFTPLEITDPRGKEYTMHSHPETKLLAILEGGMCATVDGKHYILEKGDKLIIPGGVQHSALVNDSGCIFFWSEKA